MTSPTRRRLLEKYRSESQGWLTERGDGPAEELELEISSRRNYLDALRDFDPAARFAEQLTVRLSGDFAHRGILDLELSPILTALRRIFAETKSVSLGLSDVGTGSTVLYFRPVETEEQEPVLESSAAPVEASPADDVGRTLVRVVRAVEESTDVRQWRTYVSGLEDVSEVLDRHDLDADFMWSSMGGYLAGARLTSSGRGYLRSLKTSTTDENLIPVSGRVTELRESGYVKLKTGRGRTSPTHEVHIDSEDLLALGLSLGETAHFEVREKRTRDRLGRESTGRLEFVRALSAQDGLDFES